MAETATHNGLLIHTNWCQDGVTLSQVTWLFWQVSVVAAAKLLPISIPTVNVSYTCFKFSICTGCCFTVAICLFSCLIFYRLRSVLLTCPQSIIYLPTTIKLFRFQFEVQLYICIPPFYLQFYWFILPNQWHHLLYLRVLHPFPLIISVSPAFYMEVPAGNFMVYICWKAVNTDGLSLFLDMPLWRIC